MVDTSIAIDLRLINENVEFLLLWIENEKSGNGLFFLSWKGMTFHVFLVTCAWQVPRISPGQVQNYQTFKV